MALGGDGSAPAVRPVALAYRALGLGDLLTAVPALRGLRAALRDHELVLATTAGIAPLAVLIDAVTRTVVVDELAAPVAVARPDVAVNLHGHGPQSTAALRGLGPRRLVAYDETTFPREVHEVERWCALVDDAFGGRCDRTALALAEPPASSAPVGSVVIHPGAAYPSRRWPADRFAAVARSLAAEGHPVVVTGSPAEVDLARDVAELGGLAPDAVVAGRTDVLQLAAVIASARLVVCGDTGVAHLASAYARPSVVLFGPTPRAAWGPPDRPQHVVLDRGAGSGDPFGKAPDPALLAIEPDEVTDPALALLRPAPAASGAPRRS